MSKSGRALRAAGWVAVGAIAAGGVATAATTSSGGSGSSTGTLAATAPSGTSSAAGAFGMRGGRLARLEGRMLHGQFTVLGRDGKPVDVALQRGTVNSVSATAITLTSKDGYSHTYTITSDTRFRVDGKKGAYSDVKTNQPALVLAKTNGSAADAALVLQRAGMRG